MPEATVATKVLDHIVRSIVDNPDSVRVEAVDDDGVIILEVRVADGDLGRVIGRRGRTARMMTPSSSIASTETESGLSTMERTM